MSDKKTINGTKQRSGQTIVRQNSNEKNAIISKCAAMLTEWDL